MEAASELLSQETISIEQFKALKDLLAGFNPKLDQVLNSCSKTLETVERLQQGELVELTAEHLPENTEEEKRRKKAVLLFLKYWNQLKSEVKRVKGELENVKKQGDIKTSAKIIAYAKGPLGLITVAAVVIASFLIFQSKSSPPKNEVVSPTAVPSEKKAIKVIEFRDKKIPLSEVIVGTGTDCDSPHYHASDHTSVKAVDGSILQDPGGCGFGKVKEISIIEIKE